MLGVRACNTGATIPISRFIPVKVQGLGDLGLEIEPGVPLGQQKGVFGLLEGHHHMSILGCPSVEQLPGRKWCGWANTGL